MNKISFYWCFVFMATVLTAGCDTKGVEKDRKPDDLKHSEEVALKIVAFGNSITAMRANVKQVFAQRLPLLLNDKGIEAQVINSGVGGSHSGRLVDNHRFQIKHGMDRFVADVLIHKPDIVIIGFGHNDAYIDSNQPNGESRIPLEAYVNNLTHMIKELQKINSKVVLMTPSPIAQPQRAAFQNNRLSEYAVAVRALADEYHTGLSDNNKLFMDYGKDYAVLLSDGVHPNDEGHRLIAENLVVEVLKILADED